MIFMSREKRGEDGLTVTQRKVKDALARGLSVVEIAGERSVSVQAVNAVIRSLSKLGKLHAVETKDIPGGEAVGQ
jgi:DNA-binding NarL/FixJ family response regulator